jgi:hypothetical protein
MSRTGQCAWTTSLSIANSSWVTQLLLRVAVSDITRGFLS